MVASMKLFSPPMKRSGYHIRIRSVVSRIWEPYGTLADAKAAERAGKEPPTPKKKQRSAGYGQGRHAPPLRSGLLLLDQVSDDGSTGYLFSQPTVQLSPTETVRLDELLGRGFAPVTQGDVEFDKVSSQIIEEFDLKLLDVSKLEVVSGRLDSIVEGSECVL